ncbi:MAG TPA: YbjN domain-containing protein [Acidimicrobiales bacterium]|nr:YbjN domain-containing protein [Acidimicrobiales bacterium]
MPLTPSRGPDAPLESAELEQVAARVDAWVKELAGAGEGVLGVDRDHSDPVARRWFVRLAGEDKAVTTVWLTLRERTLHVETQFMPAPEENVEACFEYLLRSNVDLHGLAFAIGWENAIYLVGRTPADSLDSETLDRLVGGALSWTEEHFRNAMSIGFASRYRHVPRER